MLGSAPGPGARAPRRRRASILGLQNGRAEQLGRYLQLAAALWEQRVAHLDTSVPHTLNNPLVLAAAAQLSHAGVGDIKPGQDSNPS